MFRRNLLLLFLLVLALISIVCHTFQAGVYKDGTRIKIADSLRSEPKIYDTSQSFSLAGFGITLPKNPRVNYGDTVVVTGEVSGRKLVKAKLVSRATGTNFFTSIRNRMIAFFEENLPVDSAALVSGMVFGSKASLTEDFWQKLTSTGTAHVVVASGMNVSLVGGFLLAVLVNFVKRRHALIIGLIAIWVYVIMAGIEAPIVRAAIMGSVVFLSQATGRASKTFRILLMAALLMLIVNPAWISDLGFILSFAATASLVLFESKVDRLLSFVPKILRESLSTSIAAQVLVAPLLFIYFGQINLLSPLINALVLWTVPLVTIMGMISGIISLIFKPIATILLLVIYPLTHFFLFIINLFS